MLENGVIGTKSWPSERVVTPGDGGCTVLGTSAEPALRSSLPASLFWVLLLTIFCVSLPALFWLLMPALSCSLLLDASGVTTGGCGGAVTTGRIGLGSLVFAGCD